MPQRDPELPIDEFELIHEELIERAQTHFKLKEYDRALSCAKRAFDLGVHPDRAATAMAGLSNAKRDYEATKHWAEVALKAGGDSYHPLRYLWYALWSTGDADEADSVAARLESLTGPSAEVKMFYALNAAHRGRFRDAVHHARAGAALAPDHFGSAKLWPALALLSLSPFDFAKSLKHLVLLSMRRLARWRKEFRGTS